MLSVKPKKGKLLIAEPALTGDVSFNRSVVLLAEHNDEGSVGFILNKPLDYSKKGGRQSTGNDQSWAEGGATHLETR